ncbi:MAG TPA: hypothetical protein VFW90_00330 [Candidatus Saccharimonadales bacterium]|nr:hypothetical protein [Candidatus Saccharimonadales bacterium]
MKKFKFSLAFLLLTVLAVIMHSIAIAGDKTPDAGLAPLGTLAFGLLLIGFGLLLDTYFIFTKSNKPAIRNRKTFWQIIGGLAIFGIIYFVYYSLST